MGLLQPACRVYSLDGALSFQRWWKDRRSQQRLITAIYWADDFTEVSLTEKAVKMWTRNYKLAYNRVHKINVLMHHSRVDDYI